MEDQVDNQYMKRRTILSREIEDTDKARIKRFVAVQLKRLRSTYTYRMLSLVEKRAADKRLLTCIT